MDARSNRIYSSLSPSLVVPSHFFCNESSTLVAIYDEPLGQETDGMTLIFPGDVPGSSPQRVVPKRVGTRTLVFSTPVYTATNRTRGGVEVLPVLGLASGEVELPPFRIGLKHPIRNVMEMCINHSTNEAVLPVLISLMVHCDDDKKVGGKQFQDPHIDRIMATLVGSRAPGASTSIKDIILPSRKWRRMNLADFGREFGLREMEKQAYMLKTERLRWVKKKPEKAAKHAPQPVYENTKGSLPLPRKRYGQEQVGGDEEVPVEVWRLMQNAEWVCTVVEDYQPREPGHLTLKTGEKVYITSQVVNGMCYGVCDGKCGYFPQTHLHYLRTVRQSSKRHATIGSLRSETDVLAGQPITDESELRQPPKHTYTNVWLGSESESSDPGSLPQLAERMEAVNLPRPNLGQSGLNFPDPAFNRSPATHLEPTDLPSKTNIFPKPVSHSNSLDPIPTSPLSPLATHAHKSKVGLKKQAFVFEDSASEASESDDPAPEEPSQAGPSQQRHAVRGNESSRTTPAALVSSCPQSRRNRPFPQPRIKSKNRSADDCSSSPQPPTLPKKPGRQNKIPLLPPTKKKLQQVKQLAQDEEIVDGHIYTVPVLNLPPRDLLRNTPPHSSATKLPISHTKSAPTQNTGSKAFNSPPHSRDLEHLTASSSHPRHKAKAMGVPVFPVAAFPNSKSHREADSGWSSAAPSTDTEAKTMPQDDEVYDDITI